MADRKVKEIMELQKGYQLAMRQAPKTEAKAYREVRRLLLLALTRSAAGNVHSHIHD